jgi:hypothetical protein
VDPCKVSPCTSTSGCAANETCGEDKLCRSGTGGAGGKGGSSGTGGTSGTGGVSGGGAGGKGGTTSSSSNPNTCGGSLNAKCAANMFCDLASKCGTVVDASGTCTLTGNTIICGDIIDPVCGCNGKTYNNDCERTRAGVLKASDGACKPDAGAADGPKDSN